MGGPTKLDSDGGEDEGNSDDDKIADKVSTISVE